MAAASLHTGSLVLSLPSTSGSGLPMVRMPHHALQSCRCRRPAAAAGQSPGGQAFRFKYLYQPGNTGTSKEVVGLPVSERGEPSGRVTELTDYQPIRAQEFWQQQGEAGSLALPNPAAQKFRIKQVCVCV